MLDRFTKLLSTQDKTTITTSNSSKKESPGLNRFVTFLIAGTITFNSLVSFGAVVAGNYMANQEIAGYSQQYNETAKTINGVIDNYNLNTDSASGQFTAIEVNAVNITKAQNNISSLMSGMRVRVDGLQGSFSEHTDGIQSITMDMSELANTFKGVPPDFMILHEIGHSLMTYNNVDNYMAMRDTAILAVGNNTAESLISVYSESHADVYSILKIAQVKGADTALKIAHQVYDYRKNSGEFDKLSKSYDSHDTQYALDKVTDFLVEHPNVDKLSNTEIYQTSLGLSVESISHWADKNNIKIPNEYRTSLAELATNGLEDITTQNVDIRFANATSAPAYMDVFSKGLLFKLLNDSNSMTYTSELRSAKEMELTPTI